MLTVVIKGNRFEAARAAADRGIPLAFRSETGSAAGMCETVGRVPDAHVDRVVAWCHETGPGSAPYPCGTCLLYTFTPDRPC